MTSLFSLALLGFPLFLGQKLPDEAKLPRPIQSQALLATVRIWNLTEKVEGSGVLIGKKGPAVYLLTAHHVARGGDRLEVQVFSKSSYPQPQTSYRSVQMVASYKDIRDLALLRLTTTDPIPGILKICPPEKMPRESGSKVLSVGCEAGKAPTILEETLSAKKLAKRPEDPEAGFFWEINRKYAPGRSGGPLLDEQGYLLGICSGVNRNNTYFAHIEEIHRLLKTKGFGWLVDADEAGKGQP